MTSSHRKSSPGPKSLFRGKIRKPVTLTLTPRHHQVVDASRHNLKISRSDLFGLLIDEYANLVELPIAGDDRGRRYTRLRRAVRALGGRLEHHIFHGPKGPTWILTLGGHRRDLPMQSGTAPMLENCYVAGALDLADGEAEGDIDISGLIALLQWMTERSNGHDSPPGGSH
jgi:hypothetical protein